MMLLPEERSTSEERGPVNGGVLEVSARRRGVFEEVIELLGLVRHDILVYALVLGGKLLEVEVDLVD